MFARLVTLLGVVAAALPVARAQALLFPNFNSTTGLNLNSAEITASGAVLLAANQQNRSGSIFTTSQYTVGTGFSAVFEFRISSPGGTSDGTSAGADGLAFVIQRSGATALGGNGDALGYGQRGGTPGISNSLAVEFDTFQDSWDPSTNHIGLNTNGSLTSLESTSLENAFDNGIKWTVWVDYNGTTLEVRANQTGVRPVNADLTKNIDLAATIGGGTAHLGFTGATGSAYGTHEVLGFAFSDTYLANGIAAVPEPSTYALLALGLGLAGLGVWRRRG